MCPQDQYENHCVAEVFYDNRWHLFDAESRAKCFREDFAAFNARNKCDEEKTKSSPPEKP